MYYINRHVPVFIKKLVKQAANTTVEAQAVAPINSIIERDVSPMESADPHAYKIWLAKAKQSIDIAKK